MNHVLRPRLASAAIATCLCASAAQSGVLFHFTENAGTVTMTASGSLDVSAFENSIERTQDTFALGYESWGSEGSDVIFGGETNRTYFFNPGTDFSEWETDEGPFSDTNYDWEYAGARQAFNMWFWNAGTIFPAIGIDTNDLVGSTWTLDTIWNQSGSFASLDLNEGSYRVTDSISGEYIQITIGDLPAVPLPAGALLLLGGLGALAAFRKRS